MSSLGEKQKLTDLPVSINDIRDKYFEDMPLTADERTALDNFDKYRMEYLNAAANEEIFEKRYLEIQARANLSSYTEFLNPDNLRVP